MVWLNAGLILAGVFLPGLSDAVRIILISTGATNLGLRISTDTGLKWTK